ncbi:hypothetical protein [Canibacter zhuwentaonis]|nr:hypothetical protein [Canibacter zhuwentaonis]
MAAQDGTMRSERRVRAGVKPTPTVDKLAAGKEPASCRSPP